MGKYEKFFIIGAHETIICVGAVMTILTFGVAATDFGLTFNYVIHQDSFPFLMIFTFFAFCSYFLSGIFHCSLLCCSKNFYKDLGKSFKQYLIIMTVSTIFAIIDAIVKLNYRVLLSILLCIYTLGTVITIVIAAMAKHELVTERLNVVQNFNNTQGTDAQSSGHDDIPKYPMTFHAEKF